MTLKRYVLICSTALIVSSQSIFGATCNPVDALTSATKDMSVTGGEACDATASIKWTERHGDGTGYCEYGTSTTYGSKANISGGSGTVSITGLTANTTYYYHFYMANGGDVCKSLKGTFKTSASSVAVQSPMFSDAAEWFVSIGNSSIKIPFSDDKKVKISLYTLGGRSVLTHDVTFNNANKDFMINSGALLQGVYMCKISSRSGSVVQRVSFTR